VQIIDNTGWIYPSSNYWMNYTVEVIDEGDYEIDWSVTVVGTGSRCSIEVDGVASAEYSMVNNGSWTDLRYYCEFNHIAPPVYHLSRGKHVVKFYSTGGNWNYGGLKLIYKP